MQISVTGRHVEITDAIRDHTHGKIEHALAEFPRVESVHVILSVEKYRHLAEIVIQAASHVRVDAREESSDMYASIDGAVDKAAKQLRRVWDRRHDHKSRERLAEVEQDVRRPEEGAAPGGP